MGRTRSTRNEHLHSDRIHGSVRAETKVRPDRYCLFLEAIEDAAGNTTRVDRFDFRTLSPARLKDANDNLSEVLVDELGRVKAMAVCGKADLDNLADLTDVTDAAEAAHRPPVLRWRLGSSDRDRKRPPAHATARFVYDLDAYASSGQPAAVASIVREEHHRKNDRSRPIHVSFEYSNGLGRVVMKKAQAAPAERSAGRARRRTHRDCRRRHRRARTTAVAWIGSGRTVLNNKGNTVKQYEPYFAVSHRYEDVKGWSRPG